MSNFSATVWSSSKHYLNLFRLSLFYQFKEFFQHSTLHGVRYIVEPGRPFLERFMWFLFTVTGLISALVIIASLWEKFQINPTITGLDTSFQTTSLTFPTVVVCPEESYDEDTVVEVAFNRLGGQNSDVSLESEEFLRQLTSLTFDNVDTFYQLVANLSVPLDNPKIRELMFLVGVKCENVFNFCKFKETNLDCCDNFHPLFTERGFCYAFNPRYIHAADTTTRELRRNKKFFELLETDKKWSLTIYPKVTSKVYIHSQQEMSSLEMVSTPVSWNTDNSVDILITMKETITTPDTKQLSIGCVHATEELSIFQ